MQGITELDCQIQRDDSRYEEDEKLAWNMGSETMFSG